MGIDTCIYVEIDDYDYVEYHTMQRWFSQHYHRGHWPSIRKVLTEMQEKFPDRAVYYSPDHYWKWEERDLVTPERLAELDELWKEVGWE